MERRDFLKLSLATGMIWCSCNNKKNILPHYLESEVGEKITLEGEIVHVCPIEGMKMKLRLSDGEIISVLPIDDKSFDKQQWDKKNVRIFGKLGETRVPRSVIVSDFKEKKLLCHIDHTPCTDTKWIENRWKDGSAVDILKRDNQALMTRMGKTQRNYIQVFSIIAEDIVEI